MNQTKCIYCGSSDFAISSLNTYDGEQVQRCKCNNCSRYFSSKYRQPPAQSADDNCPYCGSSKTIKRGSPRKRKDGSTVQSCKCKECSRCFSVGEKTKDYVRPSAAKPAHKDCPHCGSSKTVKKDRPRKREDGTIVQLCKCRECSRCFSVGDKTGDYVSLSAAEPGDKDCPYCGSSKTVKKGSPIKRENGTTVQPCKCKECSRCFLEGGRKRLILFVKGKLTHTFYDPPGLQAIDNVACPNCNHDKVVLKTQYYDKTQHKKLISVICLNCGQEFRGEGKKWRTNMSRMLGKTIPRQPWEFEKDIWDLRELYPSIEEYKFNQLFINFSGCGSEWFKILLKNYLLWRIKRGISYRTIVSADIVRLRRYGHFLEQQQITCIQETNRGLLARYYNQELCHLTVNSQRQEKNALEHFFNWGNEMGHFLTSSTLITSFDYPKVFYPEPDPLEESVINAIRDNIHVLPEPLQLMFILGFWLGTRPSELCHLRKDCLKLDPDGTTWWVEFKRKKRSDEHRLPVTTDIVSLIQKQQTYINGVFGEDYSYLFCHYQQLKKIHYPSYPFMKPIKRPPIVISSSNPMVKTINDLIEKCNIQDSNGKLVKFTGAILRPSRATHLINNGFSLDFVRIWLKHRNERTTRRHYTRYEPGQLLDVATVMANVDQEFYPYDSNPESLNPESLRQNPELHELDGLTMLNGEPLYGYCSFRQFCPYNFGRCYICGHHVASADKLSHYKYQLEQLKIKEEIAFSHGSSEILQSYQQLVNALESIIDALEGTDE